MGSKQTTVIEDSNSIEIILCWGVLEILIIGFSHLGLKIRIVIMGM